MVGTFGLTRSLVTTTVLSSLELNDRPSTMAEALPLRFLSRFRLNTTSAAVTCEPSLNFAAGSSSKVKLLPSGDAVQVLARSGTGLEMSAPSNVTSVS